MSDSTCLPQWDPAWVFPLQVNLIDAAVTCLGYGCFLILAINVLRVLIQRGLSSPRCRYLLAAVLIFLVSSTVYCAADFAFDLASLALGPNNDNQGALELTGRMYIMLTAFSHLSYLLNDVLVVWRAWVLADSRILHAMLCLSIFITIGCTIAEAILNIRAGFFARSITANLLLFIPLVFNNLLATSVVLYKTWIYRIQVKADWLQSSRSKRVERVLFLLIESGFIYCGFWVLLLIAEYVQSVPLMFSTVINALSPFLAAIYPMLIILAVEHQKSQAERASTKSFSNPLRSNSLAVQFDGQAHFTGTTGTRSVSIIQSIVEIQSAQRKSLSLKHDDDGRGPSWR